MYTIEAIYIDPDYDTKLDSHNKDIVCYVVDKLTKRVMNVAVVQRGSLYSWYENARSKWDERANDFVLATASIVGTMKGMSTREQREANDPILQVPPKDSGGHSGLN